MDPMTIITSIKTALGLAKTGNEALASSLITAEKIKHSSHKKKTNDHEDHAQKDQLILQLMAEITNAQHANLTLEAELLELNIALEKAQEQDKEQDFAHYELFETPAGSIVYRKDATNPTLEPVHYLCPSCKQKGIKSILQGGEHRKICNLCKAIYRFQIGPEKTHFPLDFGPW